MKLKTCIVGLGPHGKRWVEVVRANDSLVLSGVADKDLNNLRDFSAEVVYAGDSLDDMLQKTRADILIIATNGPSHMSIALKAIAANVKYILIEKPMACSVSECRTIEEAADKLSVRVAISKVNRFDPVYNLIHSKIKSGEWGDVLSIYIQKPGIGLGCLGTHSFDLCNYLVDAAPDYVTGWVDSPVVRNPRGDQFVDPGGLVVMEYRKSNVRAIVSQLETGAGPQTTEIHFTGARVFHDPKNNVLDIKIRDQSVTPGPGRPPVYTDYTIAADINVKGNLIAQMKALLSNLISENPVLAGIEQGKSAIEVLSAAYLSQKYGNVPVKLPLQKQEELDLYLPVT